MHMKHCKRNKQEIAVLKAVLKKYRVMICYWYIYNIYDTKLILSLKTYLLCRINWSTCIFHETHSLNWHLETSFRVNAGWEYVRNLRCDFVLKYLQYSLYSFHIFRIAKWRTNSSNVTTVARLYWLFIEFEALQENNTFDVHVHVH